MSANLLGEIFRITTFGESHGPAIGVLIDGVQPNLPFDLEFVQRELDRRRPGQSDITTQRNEEDKVELLSGVFEGKTTGTPICLLIRNRDQRSRDYGDLATVLRPGHAAFSWLAKFGIFDYRGGGRASGRETATRVAAGAVASQFLQARGIEILAWTHSIGDIAVSEIDESQIEQNAVRAPDAAAAQHMIAAVEAARDAGDSLGGVIAIRVRGLPAGLGEPVFSKLEAEMARAFMSIGAVKAFEIGSGARAAAMRGSEHNDAWYFDEQLQRPATRSNNAGGVLGGISNGADLEMRIAVKPPSSIRREQETIDHDGNSVQLSTGGRHDPCICPRVVPVAEAMAALVLIDLVLLQERRDGEHSAAALQRKIAGIDLQIAMLTAQRRAIIAGVAEHSLPVGLSDSTAEELLQLTPREREALAALRSAAFPVSDNHKPAEEAGL